MKNGNTLFQIHRDEFGSFALYRLFDWSNHRSFHLRVPGIFVGSTGKILIMETFRFAILLITGVIALLGLSGFISHLFGLDHFYTESLKEQNTKDLSGLRRIGQKQFVSDEIQGNQNIDPINQGLQDSDL